MRDAITNDLMITPDDEELGALRELADAVANAEAIHLGCDGRSLELSPAVREGVERLVDYLAADMAVSIKPHDEIITSQEAADILGMSRTYLVRLLDEHLIPIPYETVGNGPGRHRRLRLSDVLAFQDARAVGEPEGDALAARLSPAAAAAVGQEMVAAEGR
jgi:excisionase family DNA binding protein